MAMPPTNMTASQLAANQGPGIVVGNLIVAVAAIIAVVLRVWSRRLKGLKLGPDDWLIVMALPFGLAMCVVTIIAVHFGLGRHMAATPLPHLEREGKAFYSSEIIWASSIPFIKISILTLYVRIFGGLKYIRWMAWILSVFTVAWAIMVILVCAMQCLPIEAIWNKTVTGRCIDAPVFFIAGSVPDVVVDFTMLVLPMPAVWRLQKSLIERVSLIGIFGLGSLVCIISLVRLVQLIKNATLDVTWSLGEVSVWSTAEPCLGIVCACLPTMTPLLRKVKLLKSQDSSPNRRYYEDYNRAANEVSGNSSGSKKRPAISYTNRLDSSESDTLSLTHTKDETSSRRSPSSHTLNASGLSGDHKVQAESFAMTDMGPHTRRH